MAFKNSAFVRTVIARLLLECLHDSEEAQLIYCKTADKQAPVTPLYGSPIVLNANVLKDTVFKDVASIKKFQTHCAGLPKIGGEAATPKCWIFEPR